MPSVRTPGFTLALSGIAWFLSYFGARAALELPGLSPRVRVFVALVPVAPFAWFLSALGRNIRALDELERRIQLEALALAFPLAMILLMALGLLELAVPLSPDDWSYRHVWAMLPMLYFLGLTLARRRYA